jgi:hypothetical protein
MAIKKTIEINVDAKQAIKSLDELGGTFEDVNGEGAIPLSTTIGELEDRLYAMAAAGDTTSKEFKEISGQVGKMKKVIVETDLAVDGLSQTMSQNVGGALQGVASGFELAQGAMGSFGAGGEAVEEALLKVQSAMAMAQGLQGIRESIASFSALRKTVMANVIVQRLLNFVMKLNPIGLIIIAVTALGAAIALLWSPIKKLAQLFGLVAAEAETAEEANKKLTASMEAQAKVLERLRKLSAKVHENRMRELELQDASEEEKHQATLARLKEVEGERKKELQNLTGTLDNQQRLYAKAKRTEDFETARSIKTQIEADKARIIELKNNTKEYNLSRREEEKKYNDWVKANNKKKADDEKALLKERNDNYKNFLSARRDAKRNIEDLENKLIKDDEKKALDARKLAFERELEGLKGNAAEKAEQAKLAEQIFQEDMIAIKQSYLEPLLEIKKIETDNDLESRNAQITNAINAEEKETENKRIHKNKRIKLSEEEAAARFDLAKQSFQLIGDIATLFAGRSEKAAKIAFNVNKAASIAQATMDGYKAVLSTYAQTPGGPIIKGVAAGFAGAFAGVQIANIAKTEFQGGGGGSVSSAVPSGGGIGGGSNVANFNVVGNTGVNQLAETLGSQDQAPIKAFVVGSDVTTQQSLDRNKVNTATL